MTDFSKLNFSDIQYTVGPRLSGWLGPEKVPDNWKNSSPRLSGLQNYKDLLVKSINN